MAAKRTVPVSILGHEYRIRTEATPETVEKAATLLAETISRVRSKAGTVDSLDVAILAGLNIANSLVALRDSGPGLPTELGQRIGDLVELIESSVLRAEKATH